jgi:DNA-binding NtrC family response regulator
MKKSGPKRSTSLRWAQDLAESSTPIFLLDAKRRLMLFNRGCTDWTGWEADELLGQTCDYVTEPDSHSLQAVLAACAPPAEVWQGETVTAPCTIPHRKDSPQAGQIHFQPVLDAERHVVQVWGTWLAPQEFSSAPPPTPAHMLHAELAALRHQVRSRYEEDSVVARSAPMHRVLAQLKLARGGPGCVLFHGPSGSGREHLARVLHQRDPHAKQAFVPVDCRRTSSTDLKRLIKQIRGDRVELETLRAGTVFFREVAAMPRDVQERLSDWLFEKPDSQPPRIMAAVNESLSDFVDQDQFHRDLYFQLTALVIDVPPLVQRAEDILPLAQYFLEESNRLSGRQLSGFHPQAAEALSRYRWPGHIAELRTVIESAVQRATGPLVGEDDFPVSFRSGQDAQQLGPAPSPRIQPLEMILAAVEREQIQAALVASRDNLTRAAELLGMSRPKLYRRLEALGLMPDNASQE